MKEEILHLGYLNLRFSREQSRKEEGDQDIKIRIHSLHINGEISLEEEKPTTQTYNNRGILNTPPVPKVDEVPKWAKKIEREILKRTHPDKLFGMTENEKQERKELLLDAQKKMNNRNFADILPIALTLGINIAKFEENFLNDIQKRISDIEKKIRSIQSSIGWKWIDLSENQKIMAIDAILKQSGIEKTKSEIKKAVNKRIKRKAGTRPLTRKEIRNQK